MAAAKGARMLIGDARNGVDLPDAPNSRWPDQQQQVFYELMDLFAPDGCFGSTAPGSL